MTNNKQLDTMHNSYNNRVNTNKSSAAVNNTSNAATNGDTMTRMHPSMKRPRAPIACYRCHHKKVRCDGIHPNCTRCLSTGVLCAYPSSRRSRNTQPTNVDPFIDNLSQLEARIRRIETDLESQRVLVRTVCATDNSLRDTSAASANSSGTRSNTNNTLTSRMLKTEKDLQESRSIVAQLRLRGEQRAARGRRAAAAAAAAATVAAGSSATGTSSATSNSATPGPEKNTAHSGKNNSNKESGPNTAKRNKIRASKKDITTITNPNNEFNTTSSSSPPFYFSQSNSSSPVDFINPTPSYYFPYSPNPQHYNSDMTPICSNASSAPFTMMVSDWPLLNDLPQNTTVHNNGFVDPMIIAAAEAHQHGIAPPLLSVSSYMAVDEDNSIMAARAKSLSHLPPQQHMMSIPGLQPSSSSTSTCSNNSNFANYNVYDTGYTNFMDTNSSDNMMMMDQQQQNIR